MSRLNTTLMALLLVVATGTPALAQVGLSVGGRVGVGIADLDVEDDEGLDSRLGIVGGVFLGIELGPVFNLRPEVQYAQKGAEFTEDDFTTKIKLTYIEFAVPATVNIPVQGAPIQPRVYASPAIGLELGCDVEGEGGGVSASVDCEEFGLMTKSVDFGVMFGAGVDIPAGPGAITVDGRYNLGLSNINDTDDPEFAGDVKNRSWQFLAGFMIAVGA